ncbi:hypothetical protein CRG98_023923 [Punica granatum]|uniref:Uncharacterized protein n=1 Tax=Punica granatum TaxID=22663 RepID=A0A2I0JHH1_PUNGR|nr:hypothetical protein CRG98_023923 [Punica granatum]
MGKTKGRWSLRKAMFTSKELTWPSSWRFSLLGRLKWTKRRAAPDSDSELESESSRFFQPGIVIDKMVFKILSAVEVVVLLSTLCFFLLCCGCHI